MTKKHFIALADELRYLRPNMKALTGGPNDSYLEGRLDQWELTRDSMASWLQSESPRFNRELWLNYVNGLCGPNGGTAK